MKYGPSYTYIEFQHIMKCIQNLLGSVKKTEYPITCLLHEIHAN